MTITLEMLMYVIPSSYCYIIDENYKHIFNGFLEEIPERMGIDFLKYEVIKIEARQDDIFIII